MVNGIPGMLATALWRGWYRARFYTDVRGILRLLRYRRLRERYYRDFWQRAASGVGASLQSTPFGFLRIMRNGMSTFVRQSEVMLDDHLTLQIMGNKALTYSLLAELGVPVVDHRSFTIHSLATAQAFLAAQHGPVVVKPASGTGGGRGVTTGISSSRQLAAAARLAARFDSDILVERQLEGASFRLLYLDGELIDAIRREPPSVVGDGGRTIRDLVAAENLARESGPPWRSMNPLVIDRDCRNWLRENGLTLASVPARGERIQVKRAVNDNDFRGNVNVAADVGADIAKACGELVRALGVRLAGVDLYCHDIAGAFEPENCIVGEINTTPAFHHHDLVANPRDARPVGEIVLACMLDHGFGVMRGRAPARPAPARPALRATTGARHRMAGEAAESRQAHASEAADVS